VRLTNPSGNPREIIVADIGGNASVNPIQINDQDTDTILTSITTNGGVCVIRYLINSAGNAVVPFIVFQR